ncbi:MAG: sugar transferase [Ardenticatenaceae bacterium]
MNQPSIVYYRSLILLTDALSAFFALLLAYWIDYALPGSTPGEWIGFSTLILAVTAILIGIWSMRGYHVQHIFRIADESAILLMGALVGTGIFAGLLFFLNRDLSRLIVFYFFLLMPPFSLVLRVAWRQLFKWRQAPRVPTARVLVVGAGELGRQVGNQLQERSWLGLELVGYVDDDSQDGLTVGALTELEKLCKEREVDVIIVTLPLEEHGRLPDLLARIHALPVQVKLVPDLSPLAYLYSRFEMFGGMPLIGLSEPIISPWQAAVKRAVDVVIALVGLIFLTPLMALIAVGVKLTSQGPIIFSHDRVGEAGKIFRMYKFRTMVENAEELLFEEAEKDPSVLIKRPNDPRITPFGGWLRRFSLDELPQLWNVLRGDMSLVGPRPELPYLVEQYEPWQRKRLLVPQGITGWWQINGRSDKPMLLHTEDDIYYVHHFSLWLDLAILWKTAWVVLRGKGAY